MSLGGGEVALVLLVCFEGMRGDCEMLGAGSDSKIWRRG